MKTRAERWSEPHKLDKQRYENLKAVVAAMAEDQSLGKREILKETNGLTGAAWCIIAALIHGDKKVAKKIFKPLFDDFEKEGDFKLLTHLTMRLEGIEDAYIFDRSSFEPKERIELYRGWSYEEIYKRAMSDMPILIIGETGTGKELLAKVLHDLSTRRGEKKFVPINCAAIPESLFESELFGHERGAHSTANQRRDGLIHMANKGTLFLDELGKMPKTQQAKLLRVLEDGSFFRVGSAERQQVDVRILAAAQPDDIKEAIHYELLTRLRYPAVIRLPNVKERLRSFFENIVLGMLSDIDPEIAIDVDKLPAIRSRILQYNYKGNFRELRNILYEAVEVAKNKGRKELRPEDFAILDRTDSVDIEIHKPTEVEHKLDEIKLKDIIQYASDVAEEQERYLVTRKIIEVMKSGMTLRKVLLLEGVNQISYQNYMSKITKITGKSIEELSKIAKS